MKVKRKAVVKLKRKASPRDDAVVQRKDPLPAPRHEANQFLPAPVRFLGKNGRPSFDAAVWKKPYVMLYVSEDGHLCGVHLYSLTEKSALAELETFVVGYTGPSSRPHPKTKRTLVDLRKVDWTKGVVASTDKNPCNPPHGR